MIKNTLRTTAEFIFYPSNIPSFVLEKVLQFSDVNNLILKRIFINNMYFLSFGFWHIDKLFTSFNTMKSFFENSTYLIPVMIFFKLSNNFYNILSFNTFHFFIENEKIDIIKFVIGFIDKQTYSYIRTKSLINNNNKSVLKFLLNNINGNN